MMVIQLIYHPLLRYSYQSIQQKELEYIPRPYHTLVDPKSKYSHLFWSRNGDRIAWTEENLNSNIQMLKKAMNEIEPTITWTQDELDMYRPQPTLQFTRIDNLHHDINNTNTTPPTTTLDTLNDSNKTKNSRHASNDNTNLIITTIINNISSSSSSSSKASNQSKKKNHHNDSSSPPSSSSSSSFDFFSLSTASSYQFIPPNPQFLTNFGMRPIRTRFENITCLVEQSNGMYKLQESKYMKQVFLFTLLCLSIFQDESR